MSNLTLAEKVYNVALVEGPIGDEGLDRVHQGPRDGTFEQFDTFAWDCMDWGYIYGVALAIARVEDPFETNAAVAERALAAAREVSQRWAGVDRPFGHEAVTA